MMKFQYAINLGLATLLVVPAVTLGASTNDSLEDTLARTIQALEQLAGIEQRLHEHDVTAIDDARAWSEAPLAVPEANPGARDDLLLELRGNVARLQGDLDGLQSRAPAGSVSAPPLPADVTEETSVPAGPATVGLDELARRRLTQRPKPAIDTAPVAVQPAQGAKSGAPRLEPEGYTADPLKLGRAYYRQGRYDQALTAFEGLTGNVEGLYWKARSLEKLGRNAEAIAAFGQVIATPDGGALIERAKEDLDFLQWRLGFDKTRSNGGGKQP